MSEQMRTAVAFSQRARPGWPIVQAMSRVARYGKAVAHEGKADELAELLLAAAGELEADPGCELYLVNRQSDEPDVIWVTELWRSQADLDASIERIRGSDRVAAAMALVSAWELVELEPLGGKGPPAPPEPGPTRAPHTVGTLTETEDSAAKHGLSAIGESRFPTTDVGAEQAGLSDWWKN
jgi:quinol monooxygenase YgiN